MYCFNFKSVTILFWCFRYDLGLVVSCILLLILTPITFGLFCGFCGKRPDAAYADDNCTKGTGARFLMMYVLFFFSMNTVIIFAMHTKTLLIYNNLSAVRFGWSSWQAQQWYWLHLLILLLELLRNEPSVSLFMILKIIRYFPLLIKWFH